MPPADSPFSSGRHRALRVGLALITVVVALPPGAGACSMIVSHIAGALGADGAVVYAIEETSDARPGLVRLAHYTPTGIPTGEGLVDLEISDVHIDVKGLDGAGNVWLALRCYGHPESELCDSLIELAPNGEITQVLPLPERRYPRFDVTRRAFLDGRFERHGLSVFRYPSGKDDPDLLHFELPQDVVMERFGRQTWALDDAGVAVATQSNGEVTFLRYGAEGRPEARSSFPIPRPGRAFDDPEIAAVGHVGTMTLAEDGTLFASQYALAADCEVYQPPSVAILDAAGNLVRVAPADDTIRVLRVLDDELIVLQNDGRVLRLTHDGTRIETWTPDLGHWRQREDAATLRERAAVIDRSAAPAEWLEAYPWAANDQRAQILDWLLAVGPGALEDADDRFWRRIGSQLCKRHPGAAPSEALRRFARSQGRNKVEWLTTLVHCFEQPPPEAYAYALAIDGRDDPYAEAVEKAFRAWGYPRTALDALWQQATGSKPEPTVGKNLLRVFDQVAEDFDDRLRHGAQAERGIVRQLLFETVDGADVFFWVDAVADEEVDVPPAPTWSRLIPSAREWAESEDPFVAATGRLLLAGHRDVPAAAALPILIADAEHDPSLVPWLAYALGIVVVDRNARGALPRDALEQLVAWALDAPSATGIKRRAEWGSLYDPYHWLFETTGDVALDRLYARALEPSATDSARNRLLTRIERQPWILDEAQLQGLLNQPWLKDRNLLPGSLSFLSGLARAIEGSDLALQSVVRSRFRELFLHISEHAPRLLNGPANIEPELLPALAIDDVIALVDRQGPTGVRRWLWLIAAVGAWPEIESDVEAMLGDPHQAVSAAIALAPRQHPGALEVLMRDGLNWHRAPPSAFVGYGDLALKRLIPLGFHKDRDVRQAVRRVLRAFDLDSETLERLDAEVAATLAENELPDVETVLILDDAGRDVMPRLLAVFKSRGLDTAEAYLFGFGDSVDFARAIVRWADGHPAREAAMHSLRSRLSPLVSPEALAWRAELEAAANASD